MNRDPKRQYEVHGRFQRVTQEGERMKIAATISDAGMALNVGGPVNQTTHILVAVTDSG